MRRARSRSRRGTVAGATRPAGVVRRFPDVRPGQAASVISEHLALRLRMALPGTRGSAAAIATGCRSSPARIVPDVAGAVAAAEELRTPVALKAIATGLIHKTDAGGVRLGLEGGEAVRAAAAEIESAVAAAGHPLEGLLVQSMAPTGIEMIVGVVNDRSFGPVVACGAGGIAAELIKDVAVRITPVTDLDASEMLRSLQMFPLLDGYRGAPRADIAAIEDVLLRVGAMVDAHPEIVELDCNPLIVGPDGAMIVDARVRVEAAPPAPPMPSIRA